MSTSTFVLLAAGSLGSDSSAPPTWSALDRELEALSTSLGSADASPALTGWIQTRFAFSSDVDAGTAPGRQDLSGFQLDTARIAFDWKAAPGVSGTIRLEAGDPATSDVSASGVGLLDAYATVEIAEHVSAAIGRLSQTVLWSSGIGEDRRIFLDRSFVGEALDGRDIGVEVSGSFGAWNVWAAIQNGSDLAADGYALSARASCNLLGSELPSQEGGRVLVEDARLTLGIAGFDDTSLDDGTVIAADAFFTGGIWSASAEWVQFGDDLRPLAVVNSSTGAIVPSVADAAGARSAWNSTLGCVLDPNAWELAARWQVLDDAAETTIASAGVVHYAGGSGVRWIAQVERTNSDDSALEHTAAAAGLIVGF